MKGGQTILSPLGPEVYKQVFFQSLGATNNWITETRKDKEQWGSLDLKSVLIITAYLPLERSDLLPCLLTILCFESAAGSSKGGPLKCFHNRGWIGMGLKKQLEPRPTDKNRFGRFVSLGISDEIPFPCDPARFPVPPRCAERTGTGSWSSAGAVVTWGNDPSWDGKVTAEGWEKLRLRV